MAKLIQNRLKFLTVLIAGLFNNTVFSQDDGGSAAGSDEKAQAEAKGQLSAGAIAAAVAAAAAIAAIVIIGIRIQYMTCSHPHIIIYICC